MKTENKEFEEWYAEFLKFTYTGEKGSAEFMTKKRLIERAWNHQQQKLTQKDETIKKLVEVVRFYAEGLDLDNDLSDVEFLEHGIAYYEQRVGKKARQVLKELGL